MDPARLRVERNGALPYLLARPKAQASTKTPVLCFLHGYDEGAPAEIREALTRHGPLRPGNPGLVLERFVVVAPQLPTRGDLWHRYADAVHAILNEVHRVHGGDPARTYLTGFSFGANGVFDLAALQPGAWSALWAVDPTRVPRIDPRAPVWVSFGEVARRGTQQFIHALRLHPAGERPDGDRVFLDEGADHVGSAALAYADERI